jgi:hypothetical protein
MRERWKYLNRHKEFELLDSKCGRRGVLEIAEHIGTVLTGMDRNEEAVVLQEQTLYSLQAEFPDEKLLIAQVLRNLATAHSSLRDDLEHAAECAEESLTIVKQLGWM